MFGIDNYIAFLLAGILLNITPGQDTIYIIGRSIAQGRKAGIASALGISTGSMVHTIAAAFGLSAILYSSPVVFEVIKYMGAVYLVYLGVQMIIHAAKQNTVSATQNKMSICKIYQKGIMTNILNPKVALFFIAFLPQFIKSDQNYGVLPFLILGVTFIFTGMVWCFLLACFSSAFTSGLRKNLQIKFFLDRVCGIAFIGLGIKLFFTKR